jgi:hypothetical protein
MDTLFGGRQNVRPSYVLEPRIGTSSLDIEQAREEKSMATSSDSDSDDH